jgi:hypothetical protein
MLIQNCPPFVIDMLEDQISGDLIKLLKKQHRENFRWNSAQTVNLADRTLRICFLLRHPQRNVHKRRRLTKSLRISMPVSKMRDKNKRLKAAEATSVDNPSSKKHTSEGASTHGSVPFLKGSGKRKSPDFLSDKPSLKKQKYQRPAPGRKLVQDSTSMPFVKNDGKQKGSISELADLAGKEKLTAAEVRKLKPKMSGTT